jgi:hypothetical protein
MLRGYESIHKKFLALPLARLGYSPIPPHPPSLTLVGWLLGCTGKLVSYPSLESYNYKFGKIMLYFNHDDS